MATPAQRKLGRQRKLAKFRPADVRKAKQKHIRRFKWTGFAGKTLWDWLPILIQLLAALALPIVLFVAAQWLSAQQSHSSVLASFQQHQTDIQIANDQQQEATLTSYLNDMSDLLLNHNLRNSKPTDEVRQVALERTLTAIRRLKAERNKFIFEFLRDAGLIGKQGAVINLSGHDLSSVDLEGVNLNSINLSATNLANANLTGAYIGDTDLSYADLRGALLSRAVLSNSNLAGADLRNANLSEADLRDANLSEADLRSANLRDASLLSEQLANAYSLQGATMPDGSTHP